MLTGRDMQAEEAERVGLVSVVHDDVVAAGVELGQRIATFSQPGIELTKKSLQAGIAATLARDLPASARASASSTCGCSPTTSRRRRGPARRAGRPVFRDDR